MTAQVLQFSGITRLNVAPDQVIEAAQTAKLTEVVICGVDENGNEYFASSVADAGTAGWHLDRAKWALMRKVDQLIEGEE